MFGPNAAPAPDTSHNNPGRFMLSATPNQPQRQREEHKEDMTRNHDIATRAAIIARGKDCRARADAAANWARIDGETTTDIGRFLIETAVDPRRPPIRPVKKNSAHGKTGPRSYKSTDRKTCYPK